MLLPTGKSAAGPDAGLPAVYNHFHRELSSELDPRTPLTYPFMSEGDLDPLGIVACPFPRDWATSTSTLKMDDILRVTHRLTVAKAPGPAGIANEILRYLALTTLRAIHLLFNHLVHTGHIFTSRCESHTILL